MTQWSTEDELKECKEIFNFFIYLFKRVMFMHFLTLYFPDSTSFGFLGLKYLYVKVLKTFKYFYTVNHSGSPTSD